MADREGRIRRILNSVDSGLGRADDAVQGFVRDQILRLPSDGTALPQDARLHGVRHHLGTLVHHSSDPNAKTFYRVGSEPGDKYGVLASRALQAGGLAGVTGAGLALLDTGEDIKEASKPTKTVRHQFTAQDKQVMKDVQTALIEGSLSGSELNEMAAAGAFTKPQLALISDIHDWSRPGNYPFGDLTIAEAVSP